MRKSVKAAITIGVLAASALSLFACSFGGNPDGGGSSVPQNLGTYTGVNDKLVDFSVSDGRDLFRASNGYGNGGMFDCDFAGANVEHDSADGVLNLRLT